MDKKIIRTPIAKIKRTPYLKKTKNRWFKKNLVTMKGGYDIWKCTECGYEEKTILNRKCDCPECSKKDLKGKPLGWWRTISSKNKRCPKCKRKGKVVPKKGHPLSAYWIEQIRNDESLMCCTHKCLES